MALYSRVHVWVSNETLTASDLNAEFNNILTNATSDSLIGTSANTSAMQATVSPGGVGSESLASNVTGELQRLRYMIAWLASTNGSNWYDKTGRNLGAGGLAVKGADAGTMANQLSSACSLYNNATSSYTDVTNLSVTVTTTGGMLMLALVNDGSGAGGEVDIAAINGVATTSVLGTVQFYDVTGAAEIVSFVVRASGASSSALGTGVPCSSFMHFFYPAAGTRTYKVTAKVQTATNTQVSVQRTKLLAIEFPVK